MNKLNLIKFCSISLPIMYSVDPLFSNGLSMALVGFVYFNLNGNIQLFKR